MSTAASPLSICAELTDRLAGVLGPRRYAMWFDRSARIDYDQKQDCVRVLTLNDFIAQGIERNFREQLADAAYQAFGRTMDCEIKVEPHLFARSAHQADGGEADKHGGDHSSSAGVSATPLGRKEATQAPSLFTTSSRPAAPRAKAHAWRRSLEEFVVGACNQLAFTAANQLVEHDPVQPNSMRLLFIHGGCGLGKTHLLQGVCTRMIEQQPDARVRYITGEQFTNEFLTAVRNRQIDGFRRRIRQLDLLAIDDVHFIANKQATQQEFLHCLDAIALSGARIVMTSDCHPRQISLFSEALVSRCICGMVAQVGEPDADLRSRLLLALGRRRGLVLMEQALTMLTQRCRGSVRDLEGALTKLHALAVAVRNCNRSGHHAVQNGAVMVDPALIRQLYDDQETIRPKKPVRIDAIVQIVSDELGVDPKAVRSRSRRRSVVLARALVVHLAYSLSLMSYPEIARALARPNHSSVITAAHRIQRQIADPSASHVSPDTLEATPIADLAARLRQSVVRQCA